MTGADDLSLIREALTGDHPSFERLVERYQGQVYNAALRITGDRAEAEDVAQNVFLKVYENLSSFDPRYKFFSWLYRITVNESLNADRRRKSYENLDEDIPSDDGSHDELDQRDAIQEGLLALRPEYRAVIVLRHFQDLTYEEIGDALRLPVKKVKSRLFTARMQLREILERKGLNSGD